MMVHLSRSHRKGEEGLSESQAFVECANVYRRSSPRLLCRFILFSLISCSLVFAPRLLGRSSFFPLYLEDAFLDETGETSIPCPLMLKDGSICCDRSGFRSDICYMKGNIRISPTTSSVFCYTNDTKEQEETTKIKPYTRKWETSVMNTIEELTLVKTSTPPHRHLCDVHHSAPAIFFSTGGYTGNAYHEFNDGILPLYITSQSYKKEVVFVILEFHNWWVTKYGDILSHLTSYPPIDFARSEQRHCFSEAIVGLNIHDELTVNPSLMHRDRKSIVDFRHMLDAAYRPRIRAIRKEEGEEPDKDESALRPISTPKLVIISRNDSRAILNQERLVVLAEELGFVVQVLWPTRTTELAKIYRALNCSDVMVGVHGAAMTHFLFMRPGTVFIQVVPLGTEWAAQTYYGEPSVKLGLKYMRYKILPRESSLYAEYDKEDPVLTNPSSLTKKGWEVTKHLYLERQNVTLDMERFRKRLEMAYVYSVARRREIGQQFCFSLADGGC